MARILVTLLTEAEDKITLIREVTHNGSAWDIKITHAQAKELIQQTMISYPDYELVVNPISNTGAVLRTLGE